MFVGEEGHVAEISYLDVPFLAEVDVFWLNLTVDQMPLMHRLDALCDAIKRVLAELSCETFVLSNYWSERATRDVLQDHEESLIVLEDIEEADYVITPYFL